MKKLYKAFIILPLCGLSFKSISQGCVAVRHMSCAAGGANSSSLFQQKHSKFQLTMGYRYFESFRHFVGDVENKERIENNTQVINNSHSLDVGVIYQPNPRLALAVNLPIQHNDRSSLYEHYGNSLTANPEQKRFHTQSQGIGDARISASYWMINPAKITKFNFTLGGGVKLPTGNYKVTDEFHKLDKEKKDYTLVKPVDQSIQLGDGGVGVSIETQGYAELFSKLTAYFNAFYLSNPRETNGVVRSPESTTVDPLIKEFSVADQFAARVGLNYSLGKGLSVMGGGRVEGVPSSDLIGGDKGFRRPGYIVSVEPGIAYMNAKTSVMVNVPVAVYRNRTKSFYDKQDPTGVRHGDAAFADYLVSVSLARWF